MQSTAHEPEIFKELRRRGQRTGGVFWSEPGTLCVLDPREAQRFNRLNFADQTLSDRFVDLLRRRRSARVSWTELRAAWSRGIRQRLHHGGADRLADAMAAFCDASLGNAVDIGPWSQELCGRSLVPWVIDGLTEGDRALVHRDRRLKTQLMVAGGGPPSWALRKRSLWAQYRAGRVVRRELRERARQRRPRRRDLTDPMVEMLPRLGLDRAVDGVTAVLTAIAGPPGSAAACLLFELSRHPRWMERLRAELTSVTPQQLAAAPSQAAPGCHAFVKECLRLWSLPLLMVRPVHVDMTVAGHSLVIGQRVLLSAYFLHRDARWWPRPETFEPQRWLDRGASGCPVAHGPSSEGADRPFAPFGWAPRACLGAGLAVLQLMLLCRLMCTRYRLTAPTLDAAHVELGTVPRVLDFSATITDRAG